MSRIIVIETIKLGNNELQPGRLIRTSDPKPYLERYGKKVKWWANWPQPLIDEVAPPVGEKSINNKKK